jgi:uncharacterized DUF497 family protein
MQRRNIYFDWSLPKAASNLRKHGVSFEQAATAFDDDSALVVPDEEHAAAEPREILIGYSEKNRLIFVSFVRRADDLIRIIGARPATRKERKAYEEKTGF